MSKGVCRNDRYGNCGPIREGDEYCIFHKPEKSEEEAEEFYELLAEQGREEALSAEESQRLQLLGIYKNTKMVFEKDVKWQGYVFPGGSDRFFVGATFKGLANFWSATFECEADFRNATFECKANFMRVTFECEGNFMGETFEGDAYFESATFAGKVDFWSTTFKCEAYFGSATFKGRAIFGCTTFECTTYFRVATFNGDAYFKSATFKGDAYFDGTTFERDADFRRTTYMGTASFDEDKFAEKASFAEAVFERPCYFINRKFSGTLSFANTRFQQGVVMERDWQKPEPGKYKLPQAEQEGCRVQRLSYENLGEKEAAERMFVREMRAKLKTQCKPYQMFELIFIDLPAQYGTNWRRVLKATALIILLFAAIYSIGGIETIETAHTEPIVTILTVDGQPEVTITPASPETTTVTNFLELFYFSAATFTTWGTNSFQPVGIMRYVATAQSLIGTFTIALFVLVFARKWMR